MKYDIAIEPGGSNLNINDGRYDAKELTHKCSTAIKATKNGCEMSRCLPKFGLPNDSNLKCIPNCDFDVSF